MAAGKSKNGTKATAKPVAPATRGYTVVRRNDDGSQTVVKDGVSARRQEDACDQVVDGLPTSERNGKFGAYLTSSYREFEYETEPTVVTRKKRVDNTVPAAPAKPEPVAAS